LLLDNYDSFTYNLAQYLGELGCEVEVHRNDRILAWEQIARRKPEAHRDFSRNRAHRREAGISVEMIQKLAGENSDSGGFAWATRRLERPFGGKGKLSRRAPSCFMGRPARSGMMAAEWFRGLPNPFTATRYHSLIVERKIAARRLASHRGRNR